MSNVKAQPSTTNTPSASPLKAPFFQNHDEFSEDDLLEVLQALNECEGVAKKRSTTMPPSMAMPYGTQGTL